LDSRIKDKKMNIVIDNNSNLENDNLSNDELFKKSKQLKE